MAASAPPVATSAQTRRPPWAEEDRGALKAKLDWLQRDGKFRLTLPWDALQTFARMPMQSMLAPIHLVSYPHTYHYVMIHMRYIMQFFAMVASLASV